MLTNLLYRHAIEVQHEREKELLNLTEEEYLIRKAKLVKISNGIKIPNINLNELLQAFSKRILQPGKKDSTVLHAETNCC